MNAITMKKRLKSNDSCRREGRAMVMDMAGFDRDTTQLDEYSLLQLETILST